jgi:hypothetical protein
MPTDERPLCLSLPGAVVSTCVVMLVGLAAHGLAGGALPATVPTLVAGLVLLTSFAMVARGSVRPLAVAPLAAASQVLLHALTDVSAAHLHHAGFVDAARCVLQEPAMPVAHGIAVALTVLVLLLLQPLLRPGGALPALLRTAGLVVPELPATGPGRVIPVGTGAAFAVHAPRRGPPGGHAPA